MWHFLLGYVILQIEGVYPERLLGLLRQQGVALWDVYRDGESLTCSLLSRDFRRLHALNRRCRCRIHIKGKRGGVFLVRRLLKRWVLLVGMCLTLLVFCWASRRIWLLDIEGCRQMDGAVLRQALYDQGLFPGARADRLYLMDIGSDIAARYEELSFVSLHVDGIVLRVKVRETLQPPDAPRDLSFPCHVIAAKAGVITAITALRGQAKVQVGDKVQPGQVLISGEVTAYDGSTSYRTHAYGQVQAAVVYQAQVMAPKTQTDWAYSNEEAPFGAICWRDKTLVQTRSPFWEHEQVIESIVPLSPWPLCIQRGVYREKIQQQRPLSVQEQQQAAMEQAQLQALLQVPRQAKILMLNPYTLEKNGELWGVCTVTAEENIGITKEIDQ